MWSQKPNRTPVSSSQLYPSLHFNFPLKSNHMAGKPDENQPGPSSPSQPKAEQTAAPPTAMASPPSEGDETKKWGTHVMGPPAAPTTHPDNQMAASWKAGDHQQQYYEQQHQPYLIYSPVDRPNNNPLEPVIGMFNSWSNKAESIARNIWHNLKTGSSVTGAAWGKVNLTAKAMTEGGFESLYKQIFPPAEPNERLIKTFACYLSTTTGPVAGTIYLSTTRVAFCSDRPLCFTAPSGQDAWYYYKVMIPLGNIGTVNPVIMQDNQLERYIQIGTIDGHDFWFMGFVNFEKASHHLLSSVSGFRAHEIAA